MRKVVSLVLAALLMVTLFPLGIFASALATSGDDVIVDPVVLQELADNIRKELLSDVKKTSVSTESVDLGGGLILSKTAYEGVEALENNVKVVVELSDPSFFESGAKDLKQFKEKAAQAHSKALQEVKTALPSFEKQHDLYATINGFTGLISLDELKSLLSMAGKGSISHVYVSDVYQISAIEDPASYIYYEDMKGIGVTPDMVNSAPLIGAPEAWNLGYTGSGTYVAVIDTGIDYTHENFGGYSDFPNEKIPYGYDFADGDDDPMDHNGHGTHVAGTVAGIGKAKFQDKDGNWVSLKGIAPDAKLIVAKVFADDSPYAYTADIVAAIEYLIKLKVEDGVNIVAANMSLGSDKGFDAPTEPEQKAIKNAYEAGITFAISAGNEAFFEYALGPNFIGTNPDGKYTSYIKDPARVGAPGASRYAITVAAVNNQGTVLEGQKLKFNDDYVMYLTSPESPDPVSVFNQEPVTIVDTNSQFCSVPEGNEMDYSGKVLLIDRGTCTFGEKVNNALAVGASGVVVGNNDTDASLINMALGTAANTIPAVFIGGPDKLKLRSAIQDAGGSLQVVFSDEIARSYAATNPNAMASFTSWGPAPNMAFKPTVSAPGVAIFSSVPGNQYATYQGTSMAAPHVAGAVAVIKQAHPNWTPEQIKQALVSTAEPISRYSPRVQGAGRINVAKAVSNNVFITYNGQPYAELGAFTGNKTITLTITNKGTTTYTANISGYVTTSLEQVVYGNQGGTYTVGTIAAPSSVSVEPGATETIQVTIQPSEAWTNIFVEGRLLFTSEDRTRVFPFLGYFGDWAIYSDKDTINGDSKWPDNNNIIDLPWWNGFSWSGLTGIYYPSDPYLYYIGMKNGEFESKALAISAGSKYSVWNDSLVVALGMLRNAEGLTLSVVDKKGKTVRTIATEEFVRAAVSEDGVSMWLNVGWEYEWIWDGTDDKGNLVPDGQYLIRIEAYPGKLITGQDTAKQIMEIPVLVDRKVPTFGISVLTDAQSIAKNVYLPTASVVTSTFTGKDDSTILEYIFGDVVAEAQSDENNTATVSIPVAGIGKEDGEKVAVPMGALDGAGNLAASYVTFIYDNPSTPPAVSYIKVNAVPNRVMLSFKVNSAPGATYSVDFTSLAGTKVYETSGVVDSAKFNQTITAALDSGSYTMNLAVTDIYGVTTATQIQVTVK